MERLSGAKDVINNSFYEALGDKWYTASDHPIALLRAENTLRAPWVIEEVKKQLGAHAKCLDMGCGGGFLSNALAASGFDVTGIDLCKVSLDVARKYDQTRSVKYLEGNACHLPFEDGSFDVVLAMDILEHVDTPLQLIKEAARVLKPNGLFFFHTFNRNFLSYLVAIKGMEWFVENTPKNIHVYPLFIKPCELKSMCKEEGLDVMKLMGFSPKVCSLAFWKMLYRGKVPSDFSFHFTKSLATGYCGYASKL